PIIRAIIDFYPHVPDSDVKKVKSEILKAIDGKGIRLEDWKTDLEGLFIALTVMDFFLYFTTVIAMVISSFSLISSMYTNINEQSKEIGILRAIGAKRFFIWKLYIFESLILILASAIIGIIIGLIVGYTLLAQQILFTQ